jgi:hypothetical protein
VQSAHAAVAGFAADGLVADATAQAGAASSLAVTPAGEALLADAAARLAELDAAFAAAHPGLTETLRRELEALQGR